MGSKAKENGPDGVAAVERALAIIGAFEANPGLMSLAELAQRTDLYKSTVLRLLVSLIKFGYVTRVGDAGYRLGPMAYRLGAAYDKAHKLADHVAPVLRQLVLKGTESASFHVRQDAETRLCLFRVDSHHPTVDRISSGDTLPLHRGAAGRLLLACDGVSASELPLLQEFLLTISYGERDPVCAGLASPVFGPDDRVCGALSLSGPRERFTDEAVHRMSLLLIQAAADLSRSLGGRNEFLLHRLRELSKPAPYGGDMYGISGAASTKATARASMEAASARGRKVR